MLKMYDSTIKRIFDFLHARIILCELLKIKNFVILMMHD